MDYSQEIWNRLLAEIGNEYGVAGLMGNLYAESGLIPNNLEDQYEIETGYSNEKYTELVDLGIYTEEQFVNDRYGYGLAQWTYPSRKQGLYNRYKANDYETIASVKLQINYLLFELNNDYSDVMSVLKNATNVREASDKVLHDFENPKDQSTSVEIYRANLGINYYNKFAGGEVPPIDPDEPGGDTPDDPAPTSKKRKGYNFVLFNKRRRIYG